MAASEPVGPWNVELDLFLESGMRQFGSDAADGGGRDAGRLCYALGCVVVAEKPLGEQLENWHRFTPIAEAEDSRKSRCEVGGNCVGDLAGAYVVDERVAVFVTRKQAVFGSSGGADHQPGRIGVAHEVIDIDLMRPEQLLDHGPDEQPVAAWPEADPLVGDGAVARPHRIDRYKFDTPLFELAKPDLDGIGGVVLGDPEHHEVARAVPVGIAEFPERATEGIHAGCRHVDGAEPAVGGEVRRAVLHRPPARQGLALVAAGEEGEPSRIRATRLAEPLGREPQSLLPRDLLEVAGAAFANAQQRRLQPRRRVVLHDAGRALAAQHTPVYGMIAVALDVADLAVLQEHADAAAAGTHVAGGCLDLVGGGARQVRADIRLGRGRQWVLDADWRRRQWDTAAIDLRG